MKDPSDPLAVHFLKGQHCKNSEQLWVNSEFVCQSSQKI